jgi:hypothetical protein
MPPWNKKPDYLKRSLGSRGHPKQSFLIVCEGERTEPLYFESFKVSSASIRIEGTGKNTDSLVEHTIELVSEHARDPFDQVWCVFDRDSFPAQNFNRALQLAQNNGIKVAYSNEAFELWYLLHFNYYNTGMSRTEYSSKLTELLGRAYKKNDRLMYSTLLGKQTSAVRFAEKLLEAHNQGDPYDCNPSTTIHLLVRALNEYLV